MGAATGSSIFFSGRKCDKSKQKKATLGCASWPCPNIGYPLMVYHQLPYYLMATTGEPMGTPLDTPNFPQIFVHPGPPAHHLAGFCHLPGLTRSFCIRHTAGRPRGPNAPCLQRARLPGSAGTWRNSGSNFKKQQAQLPGNLKKKIFESV